MDNLKAEMAEQKRLADDMTVKDNISKGGYFVMHDIVYQATTALPIGTEAIPEQNCVVKSLNDL